MAIDKPYWLDKNMNIVYFEKITLTYLSNIIEYFKRVHPDYQTEPTYNLAVKIYNYRVSLKAIPIKEGEEIIGFKKNNKIYMYPKYASTHFHDYIIRSEIDKRYLIDTTIDIGFFNNEVISNE